jgi:hypothetical protein
MRTCRFRGWLAALAVCVVRGASAHIVPVPPSTCVFDPVELRRVSDGVSATIAPWGTGDAVRIVYDPGGGDAVACATDAAAAQARCGMPQPRGFRLGDLAGSLTPPALFSLQVMKSGDLVAPGVAMGLAVGDWAGIVPVTLTTGLVAAGGEVVAGTPLAGFGDLALIGVMPAAALPPLLGGADLLLRLSCRAKPVPDLNQFLLPAQTTVLRGTISATRARLRIELVQPVASALDFGRPVLLRLAAGNATIVSASLPDGLRAVRGGFAGVSPDGRVRIAVRPRSRATFVLTATIPQPTLPASGGRTLVEATYQVGGLLARGERLFQGRRTLTAR